MYPEHIMNPRAVSWCRVVTDITNHAHCMAEQTRWTVSSQVGPLQQPRQGPEGYAKAKGLLWNLERQEGLLIKTRQMQV